MYGRNLSMMTDSSPIIAHSRLQSVKIASDRKKSLTMNSYFGFLIEIQQSPRIAPSFIVDF